MVTVTEYVWAGKWGPFRITSHCKECDITWAMLQDMRDKEFKGLEVEIEQKPWLDHWQYCLRQGAYHAPIVMVDGKKFHQHSRNDPLINRNKLVKYVLGKLEN